MDEATDLHKVRIFAFQSTILGLETTIYDKPSLVAAHVFVIIIIIENEAKDPLPQLIFKRGLRSFRSFLLGGDSGGLLSLNLLKKLRSLDLIIERHDRLQIDIDLELVPANEAFDPLVDNPIPVDDRLAMPAFQYEGACGLGRCGCDFIDNKNVGIVTEQNVVIGHAAIVGMKIRQDPDQCCAFRAIELPPAEHDIEECGAQLNFKGQAQSIHSGRDVWTTQAGQAFARSPGSFGDDIRKPWIGGKASEDKQLNPLVRFALLVATIFHGPDISLGEAGARDRGAGAIFVPMPKEEALAGTAGEIDRDATSRTDQSSAVVFYQRFELLAQEDRALISESLDEATNIEHSARFEASHLTDFRFCDRFGPGPRIDGCVSYHVHLQKSG